MSESSSVTMPQSVRSDPKLFQDDVDIKFSRTLNSCKVPQIRHGSVDRLLDRLTDLRFMSIDFLNTFLITYRVFTTGERILEALKKVYRSPEGASGDSDPDMASHPAQSSSETEADIRAQPHECTKDPPTLSTGCMKTEVVSSDESPETTDNEQRMSGSSKHVEFQKSTTVPQHDSMDSDDSHQELDMFLSAPRQAPIATCETLCDSEFPDIPEITMDSSISDLMVMLSDEFGECYVDDSNFNGKLWPPGGVLSGSVSPTETTLSGSPLGGMLRMKPSSDTLTLGTLRSSPMSPRRSLPQPLSPKSGEVSPRRPSTPVKMPEKYSPEFFPASPTSQHGSKPKPVSAPVRIPSPINRSTSRSPSVSPKLRRAPSPISYSYSSPSIVAPQMKLRGFGTETESVGSSVTTRSSFATHGEGSPPQAKAGADVTSSRASKTRSSSTAATTAFAVATAGSAYSREKPTQRVQRFLSAGAGATDPRLLKKRESVISTAATMRVLNILKHWVTKHQQDFDSDAKLKAQAIDFMEEMVCNANLLPAEHKAAASILRTITKDTSDPHKVDLDKLLAPPKHPSKDNFDTLSALDISEQLTYLDHQLVTSIRSEELLGKAWMKPEKSSTASHVLLVSKWFNEVSRLVVSEIVSRTNVQERVACIEKWAAIADICRCMHNYNGVLQICAAFVNSSVYRLKKTWEKLSKQTRQMIERLQTLVSSDGRFKNMRDALHRCDQPCIPYLGMYLSDLSVIDEGTPDLTEQRLVNFSKMRMIAHVIGEIRFFQQTSYRIEHHPRVTNYLLDPSRLLDDEKTYKASLEIEPKLSRLSVVSTTGQAS